jgi:lantibiotic modifying enzyme
VLWRHRADRGAAGRGAAPARPQLRAAAEQQAAEVVARAAQTGAYRLFANLPRQVWSPSLFVGTAGIGYQLLRLAHPETLPSVLLWE